ncbi:MAG: filamentous hemagglutinin N-terminal domain-containing protein [Phormidesmis sp.]
MRWIIHCLSLLVGMTVAVESAIAQITTDGSLSTPTSVTSGPSYSIAGGSEAGSNLFHSFSQFSIPTGSAAVFENAATIQNIFSRVTGGGVSNIDGKIATQNPANLFLLNPSGIVFGPNASLDIGGSFVATTANSIQFKDGVAFSTDASTESLLTVSTPTGLQMGQASGAISVQGTGHRIDSYLPVIRNDTPVGLQVEAGKTLALVGGGVSFSGGVVMTNGGGYLELGSVSQGEVSFNLTEPAAIWDYSKVSQFDDIRLAQQSLLDTSGAQGSIQIQGENIDLTEGSILLLENLGGRSTNGITVRAVDALSLTGNTLDGKIGSLMIVGNLGGGQTGDLNVAAAQMLLRDGATLRAQTFSPARGGDLLVNIQGSTIIRGAALGMPTNLTSLGTVTNGGTGSAGNTVLSTGSLEILDAGTLTSVTVGFGDAGEIKIDARDFIEVAGNSPIIFSPSAIGSVTIGSGDANDIIINTPKLMLRESAFIGSSTLATGAAGNVTINASDSIEIRGSAANSIVPSRIASAAEILDLATQTAFGLPAIPGGNSGSLTLNTPSLRVADGASITVRNDGPGTAGNLQIAAGTVFLDNQGKLSAIAQSGEGGTIFLQSDVVLLRHGSLISATAGGTGNGGNINIDTPILIGLENSDIIANASQGKGGNLSITTQGIFGLQFRDQLTPGNDITASSEFGVDGTVEINDFSVDPASGLVELPATAFDPSGQVAQGCGSSDRSAFIATGRGGLPPNPVEHLAVNKPWVDMRMSSEFANRVVLPSAELTEQPANLVEASSWEVGDSGQIALVAANTDQQKWDSPIASCSDFSLPSGDR